MKVLGLKLSWLEYVFAVDGLEKRIFFFFLKLCAQAWPFNGIACFQGVNCVRYKLEVVVCLFSFEPIARTHSRAPCF
jgi:hypothetical protein